RFARRRRADQACVGQALDADLAVEEGLRFAGPHIGRRELHLTLGELERDGRTGAANGQVDAGWPGLQDRFALGRAVGSLDGVALQGRDLVMGGAGPASGALDGVVLRLEAPADQGGNFAGSNSDLAAPVGRLLVLQAKNDAELVLRWFALADRGGRGEDQD